MKAWGCIPFVVNLLVGRRIFCTIRYYGKEEKLLGWSSYETQTQVSYSLGAKIQETNSGWEIIFMPYGLLYYATEINEWKVEEF